MFYSTDSLVYIVIMYECLEKCENDGIVIGYDNRLCFIVNKLCELNWTINMTPGKSSIYHLLGVKYGACLDSVRMKRRLIAESQGSAHPADPGGRNSCRPHLPETSGSQFSPQNIVPICLCYVWIIMQLGFTVSEYTIKKLFDILVPSWDVTYQTLSGRQ